MFIRNLIARHILLVKVAMAGSVGAMVQTAVLYVLVDFLGVYPVVANVIGAELAVLCVFTINNIWTFKKQSVHALPKRFVIFNISVLGSITVQAVVMWIGVHFIGQQWYLVYAVVGILLGLILNYLMYTRVIWKTGSPEQTDSI